MEIQHPAPRHRIALQELRELFTGREDRHRRLHGRLLAVLVLTLVLDVLTSALMWSLETTTDGLNRSVWKAFLWTSSQMLAGGSSLQASSVMGHVIEVVLQMYMVTVVAAVAGSFASYFAQR
jgi:hypothetical protein